MTGRHGSERMSGGGFRALAGLVVIALLACVVAACGSSDDSSGGTATAGGSTSATAPAGGSTADAAGTAGSVDIAYLDEKTGPLAYLSSADAAKAAVESANAAGGVNGHKINFKVYDAGGSPQTGTAAVRQAINDQPDAVLWATGVSVDSGLKLLARSGIPGFSPYGSAGGFLSPTFFTWEGVTVGASTTAWVKQCVDSVGKKVAIPGGSTPGIDVIVDQFATMVKQIGGQVVFKRVGIDGANNAAITQAAKQIKDAGAQCVVSVLYPGSPQLQVALNQLGAKIPVVENDSYGPDIEKQFGSSADGMLYGQYFASLQSQGNAGVEKYLADMKRFAPGANPICLCATGYMTVKVFFDALEKVQGDVTAQKIIDAGNQIDGYDVDGMSAPIKFPEYHTEPTTCLGYSQLKDGKWTAIDGGGVNGMVCGDPYKPAG